MSPAHESLLRAIEAFDIDGPDPPARTFAARLAREHGWTPAFASRVVREYKRFVFLAVTAGRPVCPSEQVDAAWHQHLTYTRSYWQRFCGDVLGRPLHHDPTRGGPAEADKHLRMYADTLAAYRAAFGHEPPADVWPPAAVRFGDDLHHVAVNTRHNWVVPKAAVKRAAAVLAAAVLVGVGCGAEGDPFALKGVEFLSGFFWPLAVAAVALGLLIRSHLKGPAGDDGTALGWADAAYLVGGPKRVAAAAVARLVQSGAAVVTDDGNELAPRGSAPADPVEREVWKHLPVTNKDTGKLKAMTAAVEERAAERGQELADAGLLLTADRRWKAWFLTALPLLAVVVGFGLPRLVLGLANGKPSGYLVLTLIGAVVGLAVLSATTPRRTRRGDAALARLKAEHGTLKYAKVEEAGGVGYDAGLAVALFGTAALAGTALNPLSRWYPRTTGEAGGGCGSGGCGAGCGGGGGGCGGGGGGCGGCGGGGGD